MKKLFTLVLILGGNLQAEDIRPVKTELFNNNRYELYANHTSSWQDAYTFAEQKGGHLVTITSPEEQAFIDKLIIYNSQVVGVWIGLVRSENGAFFEWITGEYFTYSNWGFCNPDNFAQSQNVAWIGWYGNGAWDDLDSNAERSFIIEYEGSTAPRLGGGLRK